MKAAIVSRPGQPAPVYGDAPEPVASAGEARIRVTAAALTQVARSRAAGTHYSASARFPFVAGVDGVGLLDDGRRVYFALPQPPNGAMAEWTATREALCAALPDDLDDVTAAAIANPGMSSWAALTERARLKPGETVLVNGATGIAGRLAVQIAKHLGAGRVVATGRDREALGELAALGADGTIALEADAEAMEARFREEFARGVGVVIDYLWGESARRLLIAGAKAGAEAVPIRFVQVGSASGEEIALPGAALRASAIELMGSGIGSIPPGRLVASVAALLEAAVPAGLKIAARAVPLAQVEEAWAQEDRRTRIVFVP